MKSPRDRQEALRSELPRVQDKVESLKTLRTRTPLPLLGQVRIARPCKEEWETMRGDDRVRFCGRCDKNVYDLSELTREQAESLLAAHEMDLCVRYYRRADGTVMTSDCPEGRRRRQLQWAAAAVVTAGLAGSAALHLGVGEEALVGRLSEQRVMMGAPPVVIEQPTMGDIAQVPEPAPTPPPERPRMGRMAPRTNSHE